MLMLTGCSTVPSNLEIPDKSFEGATLPLDFYSLTEDDYQKFVQCWQEWDGQNLLGERVYELQDATVLSFGGNVQLNPEILDLVQPWTECVTEAGLEVPLGVAPFDYTDYVWQQELPIAEEIVIAVADVRCRDEVGYSAAYYDALWDHDYQVLVDNQERLSDLPERIRASRARTEAFIDNYANQ